MENRKNLMIAVLALVAVAAGGFWWFTQQEAPVDDMVVAPKAPVAAPAAPPAPVVATPAAPAPAAGSESDTVALKEEVLDKEKAELDDLAARAADLQEQVKDGDMIVEGKAKQIAKLEAELKRLKQENAAASKKK